ncbi:MAG: hypothetical protein LWW86_07605 [Micrococcales bacterium]|nr:hypothetical protein [Micrococcales bacterium]
MADVRVYLALPRPALVQLADDSRVALRAWPAAAVTSFLRSSMAEDDDEEREYAALWDIARATAAESPGERRVIAAADLPGSMVTEDPQGEWVSRVVLDGELLLDQVASLHVDEQIDSDDELLWYDITELADVVDLDS